jgi:GNAT superfamily N-acetyltransferase
MLRSPTCGRSGRNVPETLDVRRATGDDLVVILDLLAQGARYARSRGIDQWPERFPEELILAGISRGEVFLAVMDGVAVCTLSLVWSDRVFWGHDDGHAGYVHRLAVNAERRGTGLGGRLLDWAQVQVGQAERSHLRLDCLAQNARLRTWYETMGFVHHGDREVPRPLLTPVAISLYERPVPPHGAREGPGQVPT